MAFLESSKRLSDALNSLELVRAVHHERIEGANMSEVSKASARGVVERSHEYTARLCPRIAAMFGNRNTGAARH